MDFDLTEEQEAVTQLAATILSGRSVHERLSGLDEWFDRDTWIQLADAGLLGIALPEEHGGGGLSFLELHLLLEQVGKAAAPLPAWETLVLGAAPIAMFGDADLRAELLPGVAAGRTVLTAALVEEPRAELLAPAVVAHGAGDDLRLTGTKTAVPAGAIAEYVVVSASRPDGRSVLVVVDLAADGVRVEPQEVVDGSPQTAVHLDGAPVRSVLGEADALAWLLDRARVGVAALQSGICQQALRLAADHTSGREQFGRPIATFQAVAHRVADAFIDAEGIRLTALEAAWRLSEGLEASAAVDTAAWWGADAGHRVLHAVHHVHGGIGVDREYPLHRYFLLQKRLEFCLGGASEHLRSLGAGAASRPA